MDYLIIHRIFSFLIVVASLFFGFWVYFSNKRSKTNQLFLSLTVAVSFWITFYYLTISAPNSSTALFWSKLAYATVSVFYIPFYLFFIHFLNLEKKFKFFNILVMLAGVALSVVSIFTDWIVKGAVSRDGILDLVFNKGSVLFYGTAIFLSFLVVYLLGRKYFAILPRERLKIQYFLLGIFIWIFMNFAFNMLLPVLQNSVRYAEFGNYSAIFLLAFTAYAIVKQELFGIKIVLASMLVGAMAFLLIVQTIFAPNSLLMALDAFAFSVFCVFGYYLIKAVRTDETRREEAETMAIKEKAYRESAEKLTVEFKRLNEAKSQFMMATQHHLRTPLTSIQGYLSMLLEGSYGPINKVAKSKIKWALESTQRLIKLVNEFLDVAQFEVGKETMTKKEVQVREILEEVISELGEEARIKSLYLKLEISESALPKAMVDREKIKEAIYNIVFNGIKYTGSGGIVVELQRAGGKLQITIKDTGIGMEREEIASLFEKTFERGEQAKKIYTTGRGIGLYISSQIIKANGGRLWAESEGMGKGSTFLIELPIV